MRIVGREEFLKHGGLCAACAKPGKDKKPEGCGHLISRDAQGRAFCMICDKRLKSEDKKLLCLCVRCGSWQTLSKDGLCANCRLKEKLAKAPKPKCQHENRFSIPTFAQKVIKGTALDNVQYRHQGVSCVMQLHVCPDCMERWWHPLPILKDGGEIWPKESEDIVENDFLTYLYYGKKGGLRQKVYSKLKKIWKKNKTQQKGK